MFCFLGLVLPVEHFLVEVYRFGFVSAIRTFPRQVVYPILFEGFLFNRNSVGSFFWSDASPGQTPS